MALIHKIAPTMRFMKTQPRSQGFSHPSQFQGKSPGNEVDENTQLPFAEFLCMSSNTLKKLSRCLADKIYIVQITYKMTNNALLIDNFC